MKRYIYMVTALIIMAVYGTKAQDIVPNGSFEDWNNMQPDNWIGTFNLPNFQNIVQSNQAQHGSSSAEFIISYYEPIQDYPLAILISFDIPMTGKPEALNGYYKGTFAGSDSLTVLINLMAGEGNPIGGGYFYIKEDVSGWTSWSAPVIYFDEQIPNNASITIVVGNQENGTNGTDVFIDNLTFGEAAGIDDKHELQEYSFFPNPATDILNIRFDLPENDRLRFEIVTPQGAIAIVTKEALFPAGKNTVGIPVSSLLQGMYFVRAAGDKYRMTGKVSVGR